MQAVLHHTFIQIHNRVVHHRQDIVARVARWTYAWAVAIAAQVALGLVERAHESAVDRAARYVSNLLSFDLF